MIFGLTRKEVTGIGVILVVLSVVTAANLVVSLRRSRDVQRKADVRLIADLIEAYREEFGFLPLSRDGKISVRTGVIINNAAAYAECDWGYECLPNLKEHASPAYLGRLPVDPQNDQGVAYYFISNGRRYQIYAALEGKEEYGYNPKVIARNLPCGNKICNYGLGSDETPTERSIEDYETELKMKELQLPMKEGGT